MVCPDYSVAHLTCILLCYPMSLVALAMPMSQIRGGHYDVNNMCFLMYPVTIRSQDDVVSLHWIDINLQQKLGKATCGTGFSSCNTLYRRCARTPAVGRIRSCFCLIETTLMRRRLNYWSPGGISGIRKSPEAGTLTRW